MNTLIKYGFHQTNFSNSFLYNNNNTIIFFSPIHKNQIVGSITDPFGEYKEQVKSIVTGYVVGLNNNPVVNAGDALLHVGMDDHCKLNDSGEE